MGDFCPICGHPNCTRKHAGKWGWLGMTVFVVLWDVCAPETMSAAFRRRRAHPATVIAWGVLTAHLFGALPRRFDPLHRTLILMGGKDERNL